MSKPEDSSGKHPESPMLPAELGEQLAEFARDNAIPLDADHELTGRLARVALPDQIPERVYSGVAALLAFLRDAEEAAGD